MSLVGPNGEPLTAQPGMKVPSEAEVEVALGNLTKIFVVNTARMGISPLMAKALFSVLSQFTFGIPPQAEAECEAIVKKAALKLTEDIKVDMLRNSINLANTPNHVN